MRARRAGGGTMEGGISAARVRVGVAALFLAAALAQTAGCPRPRPETFSTSPRRADRFAILGDVRLRFPGAFWRRRNDRERAVLVRTLAQRKPAFVAIHGDLVPRGSSAGDWAAFDRAFAPLRWAGVPVLPALGNHEYVGDDEEALGHYFARFPGLRGQRWYRRTLGPVAFLVLDTNRKALGAAGWQRQMRWYREQLSALDRDAAVRGVVVFGHHPPYTNSDAHSGAVPVQRAVLPPFLAARKGLALVAGHVHTYERFSVRGRVLLNIGGGGAPRHRVHTGPGRPYKMDVYRGPALRPFHFVEGTLQPEGLHWVVWGLDRGAASLRVVDQFDTPYPVPQRAAPPGPVSRRSTGDGHQRNAPRR